MPLRDFTLAALLTAKRSDQGQMSKKQAVQLFGISNAVVDIHANVAHDFLEQIDAAPGSMTLIDKARAREIHGLMGPATEMSGDSVANTIAGFANLGGRAAYIGEVRDNQLGEVFVHDMQSLGVDVADSARKGLSVRCRARRSGWKPGGPITTRADLTRLSMIGHPGKMGSK